MSFQIIALIFLVIGFLAYNIFMVISQKNKNNRTDYILDLEKQFEDQVKSFDVKKEELETDFEEQKLKYEHEIALKEQEEKIIINNIEDLKIREHKKSELIKEMNSSYINPDSLHLYFQVYLEFYTKRYEPNKAMLIGDAFKTMFVDKFLPNKVSRRTQIIMKKLNNEIGFYEEDFANIKKNISFHDLLVLKSLTSIKRNRIMTQFIQDLKVDPQLETILIQCCKKDFEGLLNSINEINDILKNLKIQRKIKITVANSADRDLIKEMLSQYETHNAKVFYRVNADILAGFIVEDVFFKIDKSHIRVVKNMFNK